MRKGKMWSMVGVTCALLIVQGLACAGERDVGPSTGSGPRAESRGWRGNWTGAFPDADPPVKWSKISKPMKGLCCRAEKPTDDTPAGVSAYCGSLTEWLVLGPFPADEDAKKAIDDEFVKAEATCEPNAGDAAGGVRWKKVEIAGSMVDFASVYSNDMPEGTPMKWRAKHLSPEFGKPFVAYAHTYVHSPMEATFRFRVKALDMAKVYVNGELCLLFDPKKTDGEFTVKLNRGWNRVLLKARNDVVDVKRGYYQGLLGYSSWYVDIGLMASRPYETDSEGIAWATLLPSYHIACPLIVGDRVFVMSKPGDVVCLRRSDGKVLWIRSTTYYDVLSDKDKRDNPAFEKVAPLVAELEKIDAAYVKEGSLTEDVMDTRRGLHQQITRLMGQADKKYSGECGHYVAANMPTPVSDGRHVYVWSELGIAACFDLDGNRKWITMPGIRANAVGRYASPALADGKMVLFEGRGQHVEDGLIALDVRSGRVVWSLPDKKPEPFSSLVPVKIAGDEYVLYGRYLVRGRDGKIMLENGKDLVCHVPTPLIEKGTMYGITCSPGDIIKAKLPTGPADMVMVNEGKVKGLGSARTKIGESFIGSPLCHGGLLYVVDQTGRLYVIDAEAQEIVYERDLGLGKVWPYDFYHAPNWERSVTLASPILAGRYVYVFGMSGTTVVFEHGREYHEVARNKIEDCLLSRESRWFRQREMPEPFASSPVAEGEHIYVRGGNYLYCIGKTHEQ